MNQSPSVPAEQPSTPSASVPAASEPSAYPMPASQPMLLAGVKWGIIATVSLMVVFGVLGWFISGSTGLVGGMLGAGIGGLLLLITVGSIAFGNRFVRSEMYLQIFFAIVLGAWILKLVGFVIAALLLRDQPWLDPQWLFVSLVATVLVSIVIDVLIVSRTRVPYVADSADV